MKTTAILAVMVLLIVTALPGISQPCADPANIYSFTYGGKNYEVIKEKKTWVNAAACAVERGGELVAIGSLEEQAAVWDAVINGAGVSVNYVTVNDGGGIAYVWIGATDKSNEGVWLWDGDDNGAGANFWNGQGANGSGNGAPVGGLYNNWGGASTGTPKEPDDYNSNQDAAAIGLAGWPAGSGTLGIAGEWNDINLANSLYFIVEYNNTGLLEPGEDPVRFSPNPVRDKLTVTSRFSGIGMAKVKVLSADGKTVVSPRKLTGAMAEIDVSGLAGGIYLVVLMMDDRSEYIHKMVVE